MHCSRLKMTDYKGWARGLKKAGYATNPKYAVQLIDIIEQYELYLYDEGLGEKRMPRIVSTGNSRNSGSLINPYQTRKVTLRNGLKISLLLLRVILSRVLQMSLT